LRLFIRAAQIRHFDRDRHPLTRPVLPFDAPRLVLHEGRLATTIMCRKRQPPTPATMTDTITTECGWARIFSQAPKEIRLIYRLQPRASLQPLPSNENPSWLPIRSAAGAGRLHRDHDISCVAHHRCVMFELASPPTGSRISPARSRSRSSVGQERCRSRGTESRRLARGFRALDVVLTPMRNRRCLLEPAWDRPFIRRPSEPRSPFCGGSELKLAPARVPISLGLLKLLSNSSRGRVSMHHRASSLRMLRWPFRVRGNPGFCLDAAATFLSVTFARADRWRRPPMFGCCI